MAYIGQSPVIGEFKKLDDISGSFDNTTATFNVTSGGEVVTFGNPQSVLISLNGVLQEPETSYSVSGSSITFTEAPNTNSTFFGVQIGSVGQVGVPADSTVNSNKILTNAITSPKIADSNVSENKIASLAVTESKIANGAVTNAKIADGNISENKIATGAVTNAKIADENISENKIATSAITNAKVADENISENKIASSAITTSKIADSSITTAKLTNNLVLTYPTLQTPFERANVRSEAVPATLTYDLLDQSVLFFTSNSTSNVTINFRGNSTTSMNSLLNNSSNTVSAILLMTNGATPYYVNNVQIDGVTIHNASIRGNLFWQGNSLTIGGTAVGVESYGFTIVKKGDAQYLVLGSQTAYKSFLS